MAAFRHIKMYGTVAPLTVELHEGVEYYGTDLDGDRAQLKILMDLAVADGRIVVDATASRPMVPGAAWVAAEDAAEQSLNAWAFTNRAAVHVALTHYDAGAGLKRLRYDNERLTPSSFGLDVVRTYSAQRIEIQRALSDYVAALNRPQDTMLHAYRGIEALRVMFGEGDAGWGRFHAALRTRRTLVDPLKAAADEVRHAARGSRESSIVPGYFPPPAYSTITRLAAIDTLRICIDRAIRWLEMGRPDSLPEAYFRLLDAPLADFSVDKLRPAPDEAVRGPGAPVRSTDYPDPVTPPPDDPSPTPSPEDYPTDEGEGEPTPIPAPRR